MGRLRRIALVAALAIASSALLPYLHGATSHVGDCGVCSVLSHGGARVAATVAAPALPDVRARADVDAAAPATLPPRRDFDPCSARAPPASSVLA